MTRGRSTEVTKGVRVVRWKVFFLVTAAIAFAGCMTQSLPSRLGSNLCRLIQTDEWIGLSNGLVELRFGAATGALISLKNLATGDEYLKR
ncbi:MAG: hypothetical protein QF886_11920, partial [Planctomycetota bacterium]|nr:hypothetical protein [Planctomycetota bacterium]